MLRPCVCVLKLPQGPCNVQGGQAHDPKSQQPQAQWACLHFSPQVLENVFMPASPRVFGSAGQSPRPKLKPRLRLRLQFTSSSGTGSQRCPGSHECYRVEDPVYQCEDGRTGVTPGLLSAWGVCPPVLFIEINLRQDLSK